MIATTNSSTRTSRGGFERERAFIDSTSHELRTPIAVIACASELALDQPDVPPAVPLPSSAVEYVDIAA